MSILPVGKAFITIFSKTNDDGNDYDDDDVIDDDYVNPSAAMDS